MLSKGTRVEFVHGGEKLFGVVHKGGAKKVEVIVDGGEKSFSGHPSFFKCSSIPLPCDAPNVMDKWGIVGFKSYESMSDETICCEGNITLDGTKVIAFSNEGSGGPNNYHGHHSTVDLFKKESREWAELFGAKNPIEPEDLWVYWHTQKRPYGVTGEAYWADYNDMLGVK